MDSKLLDRMENEIRHGKIARFPVAMAVQKINLMELYKPAYNSIFDYMKLVFKWERRKTKLVLYDANLYSILQVAYADQPWKLPKFRNQLKGITTLYQELIPAIWNEVILLGSLPETQRLESTRTIQKRLEDNYNNTKYIRYMSYIYSKTSKTDLEELMALVQNELDPVKLAITLHFINRTQQECGGLYGIKLHAVVGKLKRCGRDRVKGLIRVGSIIDSISKDVSLPLPNDIEVVRMILSPDPNHHRLLWGLAVDKARTAGCITPTKTMMKEAIKIATDYLGKGSVDINPQTHRILPLETKTNSFSFEDQFTERCDKDKTIFGHSDSSLPFNTMGNQQQDNLLWDFFNEQSLNGRHEN